MECTIKVSSGINKIMLQSVEVPEIPDFKVKQKVSGSGHELLEAYKSLKHLIRGDLSRAGLLWGWANGNRELIASDGSRVGGRACGFTNLDVPLMVLGEICRLLSLQMSEKVTFEIGDEMLRVSLVNGIFAAKLPKGERFEKTSYEKMREKMANAEQIKASKADLLYALNQVEMVASESIVKIMNGGPDSLLLEARDGKGGKGIAKVEKAGEFTGSFLINLKYLKEALNVRSEDFLEINIGQSMIEIKDQIS